MGTVFYVISKQTGSILYHSDSIFFAIEYKKKLKSLGIDCGIKTVELNDFNDSILERTRKL